MKLSTRQKGLVGHWKLSESSFNPATKRFTDSALQNHGIGNGTQLGGSPTFQTDHMGQLLQASPFNGTDDYIDCGNDSSLKMTAALTMSAWIKPTALNQWSGIIGKGQMFGSSGNYEYYMGITNTNQFYSSISDGVASRTLVRETFGAQIDTWYHHVITWNKPNWVAYVDGEILDSGTTDYTIHDQNFDIEISDDVYTFEGNIDETRIYNRALSQDEITLLYESYHPGVRI